MNAENITKLDKPPEIFVTLANAIWPPFIFAIFIGIPSAILYAFELGITIAKRNVFKSSFFKLFAIRAFWSLIGLIGNFLYSRFGRIGWFMPIYLMLPQVLLAFFYFLIVYSYSVENLSTIVLLLNRLTSLLYPVNYEKFWQKRMSLIIAAISLLPLILTGRILLSDRFVRIQADNVTFTVDNRPKTGEWNDSFIAACFSIIFSLICLLLNVGVIIAYRTNSKKTSMQQRGDANTKIMERKLTIYTIVTFIAQFIYAAYMLFLYIAVVNVFGFGLNTWQTFFLAVFNQYAWINDFSTIVIPSWLMLWASNLMQTQLKGIIPFLNRTNLQTSGGPKIAWSRSPNPTNKERTK